MPTGAGKTTLCETLLYDHLQRHPSDAAVLLVPYRSLASELRGSLVRQFNGMGISSRCAYGGTVPSGNEVRDLQRTRVLVATPEALSALLSADQGFPQRISLVICDEGHLLDEPSRGIGLELLLARFRARATGSPRFVFVSAKRTAPHPCKVLVFLSNDVRFTVREFLSRNDFRFVNPATSRWKTYAFASLKSRAVAAARKALPMGTVAIFAANKRGDAGAVGIAEELLKQIAQPLSLPAPVSYAVPTRIDLVLDYLRREYGAVRVGTQALAVGAVLHHGDIPQETREVLEQMLRGRYVSLAICTSTLAEGVNLPIRTLALYSVERRSGSGQADPLLSRDIKNLVGRAGRPGATTKGLVICANEEQWPRIERVATQTPAEPVRGGLRTLLDRLQSVLALRRITLTNEILETNTGLHALVDGIDSTLIDLAAEEIGEEALVQLANGIADRTFAAQEASPDTRNLLRTVFRLRAERVAALRVAGRLDWIRQTGARVRMLDSVQAHLEPHFAGWESLDSPLDDIFLGVILHWAWERGDITGDIRSAYRLKGNVDVETVRPAFFVAVRMWIAGSSYEQIAQATQTDVDDVLAVQARAIGFSLQTVIERGISLLSKLLESQGRVLSAAVETFPDYLRFGVSTEGACVLSRSGLRHRRAAILFGARPELQAVLQQDRAVLFSTVAQLIEADRTLWESRLGVFVLENTLLDVSR